MWSFFSSVSLISHGEFKYLERTSFYCCSRAHKMFTSSSEPGHLVLDTGRSKPAWTLSQCANINATHTHPHMDESRHTLTWCNPLWIYWIYWIGSNPFPWKHYSILVDWHIFKVNIKFNLSRSHLEICPVLTVTTELMSGVTFTLHKF